MHKASRFLAVVALAVILIGAAHAEDWKVGEKWVYKHEGPRPYGDGSVSVEGDRTTEVTAIQGEGATKRYLLKDMWGTNDPNPSVAQIDPNNMLHKIEVEYVATILFDPPVPTVWSLKVGEEKTLKTQMDLGGFALPIEYVAKRLKDETLSVPAGEFKNCQHVQVISTMQSDEFPGGKTKLEYWYHPKVRNLVKEVIVTNYQGDNSYTTTSTLESHTGND
jgi:hypothetical protein